MDVKKEFLDILQDYVDFPVEEVNTEEAFKAASGIDSFVFIEMIAAVEDRFGIRIPNSDLKGFSTIDDIIRYIEAKVA
ncbi:MAG: acyl carrier protein [Bacteroidales bacterium]|nr:acyl carrier protein [Bacteroidales bacterium]MBR6875185.1 acyl carrier protein [Bacteroidales bacterium]